MNSLTVRPSAGDAIADLCARIDLVDLVAHYAGEPGRRHHTGAHFRCPNPAHPDRSPSFSVWTLPTGKQRWKCHSACGTSGDALDLIMWLEGCDRPGGMQRLREITGTPDDWQPAPRAAHRTAAPPAPVAPLPQDTRRPSQEVAQDVLARYLAGRGWPAEVVDRFGLEVVLDTMGHCRVRHPFLVPTRNGQVLGAWQDRATGDRGPKWLAPKGRPLPLYNVAALDNAFLEAVVLCEGPADTITATLALTGTADIAAVGIAGSGGWRSELALWFDGLDVVLALDPDTAGENLAARIGRDLDGHARRSTRLHLPEGHDLSTLHKAGENLAEIILAALDREPIPQPSPLDSGEITLAERACVVCAEGIHHGGTLCRKCSDLEGAGAHRWRICDTCSRCALTAAGKRCLMTPDCPGRYRPIRDDLDGGAK